MDILCDNRCITDVGAIDIMCAIAINQAVRQAKTPF
jgi:hypothetical protein